MNENDAKEIKEKLRRNPMGEIIEAIGKVVEAIEEAVVVIKEKTE